MMKKFNFKIFVDSYYRFSKLNYFPARNHPHYHNAIHVNELRKNTLFNNRIEFTFLAKRYDTITIEEIEDAYLSLDIWNPSAIANKLTGFGNSSTCSLCTNILFCKQCYWVQCTGNYCNDTAYYHDIKKAKDKHELLNIFKLRAKVMFGLLERYGNFENIK